MWTIFAFPLPLEVTNQQWLVPQGKCLIFGPRLIAFLSQTEQQVSFLISEVSQRDIKVSFCNLNNIYLHRALWSLVRQSKSWPYEDYFDYPKLTDEGTKGYWLWRHHSRAPCALQKQNKREPNFFLLGPQARRRIQKQQTYLLSGNGMTGKAKLVGRRWMVALKPITVKNTWKAPGSELNSESRSVIWIVTATTNGENVAGVKVAYHFS